ALTTTPNRVSPPRSSGRPPRSRTLTQPSQRRIRRARPAPAAAKPPPPLLAGSVKPTRAARSGFARPLSAVQILEPDDVVQLRGRDLQDPGVLERAEPVNGAGPEAERLSRTDHLLLEQALPCLPEHELRAPLQ